MDQIVYKVTNREDCSFMTSEGPIVKQKHTVQYTKGEVVFPKMGKLFAFDNYEHARIFAYPYLDKNETAKIWVAMGDIYSTQIRSIASDSYIHVDMWEEFWTTITEELLQSEAFISAVHFMSAPHGTILCNSIKLIRKA